MSDEEKPTWTLGDKVYHKWEDVVAACKKSWPRHLTVVKDKDEEPDDE